MISKDCFAKHVRVYFLLFLSASFLISAEAAYSGESLIERTQIDYIAVTRQEVVLAVVSGKDFKLPQPSCIRSLGQRLFTLDPSVAANNTLIATLLMAFSLGKTVDLRGVGACASDDLEVLKAVRVLKD